jgi:hypothetical protein
MRPAAAAVPALAIVATLAACGGSDDSRAEQVAKACAGASSGAAALHGAQRDIAQRVHDAEDVAAAAAHALPQGDPQDPEDVDAQAVRALLSQSLRLRLVRSQIARGHPAPERVLEQAAAGLTAGDQIVRDRLAAAGVTC